MGWGGTILEHPQLIECTGICVLSVARDSERCGTNIFLDFFLKMQSGHVSLCLLGFFSFFLGSSFSFQGRYVGHIIYGIIECFVAQIFTKD